MTAAAAFYGRFQELSRTNPPDLIKHFSDVERTAVKKECLEDSQGAVRAPGRFEGDLVGGKRRHLQLP